MKDSKILRRERIDKLLDHLFEYPLTIVSATMGYGKTTSVRTYLNERKVKPMWVSLVGSQGLEDVFWKKLLAAVEEIYPEIGRKLAEAGFPFDVHQIYRMIDFINELEHNEQTVLVIDDYHLIENSTPVSTLVEMIVQEEIRGFHIVLISRTRPDFKHINLLSKGLCYTIDTCLLAYTIDEIQAYFNLMGVAAAPGELDKINRYTMGWISAIYLIMLGVKQGGHLVQNSNINQLVEGNLFNSFDKQTQEAVLSLSIFESFTIRQAAMVLENPKIYQIVMKLVEENAFIEFDNLTETYKLHNVLLDYLRERFESSDIDIKALCQRAGEWYLKQGDIITAFDYYHRAGQTEELLKYLNSLGKVDISFLGNKLICEIYNNLPRHLYIKYPILFLQIALNFVFSGEEAMVMQGIGLASQIREYYEQIEDVPLELRNKVFGELEVVSTILSFNDREKMVEHSQKAYELLKGEMSSLIFRHSEFAYGLPHFLYSYYKEVGKLKDTLECIIAGFPPVVFDGCGVGCDYIARAELALETGDVEQAKRYAQKAIYKARTKMQVSIELCANFTLMRICLLEGKMLEVKQLLSQTRELLAELRSKLPEQNNLIYSTTMDLCEGYIYGCAGTLEMIPKGLRNGDFSEAAYIFQGLAFPYIIYGKAILLSGDWLKLEVLCESFKESFHIFHNQLGLLHNAIHEAVAKYKLYGMKAGIQVLLPTLIEAEADGILLPFAENADYILPMLEHLNEQEAFNAVYLKELIQLCRRYSKNLKVLQKDEVALTTRESQVLCLLAEGLTQKEIAERLYLSVSSVKRQLENLYQKLGANNKITAIKSAEKLNLL